MVDITERLRLNEDDWVFGNTARTARKTIEQLTARVRELEEEQRIAELIAELEHIREQKNLLWFEFSIATQQLAASQLHAEQLREVLRDTYVELFHCDQQMTHTYDEDGEPMWHTGATVTMAMEAAKELLDKPSDTSALDAYVAEKVKEAMK